MNNFAVCLWFNGNAEEATHFYCNTFKNSRVGTIAKYGEFSKQIPWSPDKGIVMTVQFELDGLKMLALNGGPAYQINPSISMFASCESTEEIDRLFATLAESGSVFMPLQEYPFATRYAWVQDKYGVSWQLMLQPAEHGIVPCIWFAGNNCGKAAEAIDFYTKQFSSSSIEKIEMAPPTTEYPKMVKQALVSLNKQKIRLMDANNGSEFPFNPGVSFIVYCKSQNELDDIWNKLSAGGTEVQCGWLTDKYGISWQITPEIIPQLIGSGNSLKSDQVMNAVMKMVKLNIAELQKAFDA